MTEARGTTQGPVRKKLPCEFAPPKQARAQARNMGCVGLLAGAAICWIGVQALKDGDGAGTAAAYVLFGALFVAGGIGLLLAGKTSVLMTDEGLVLCKLGKKTSIRWDDVAVATLSARRKEGQSGSRIGRAIEAYIDDPRALDPYADGRARRDFDPSGSVSDAHEGLLASFPDTLGWSFFSALYAECVARGIEVRRA